MPLHKKNSRFLFFISKIFVSLHPNYADSVYFTIIHPRVFGRQVLLLLEGDLDPVECCPWLRRLRRATDTTPCSRPVPNPFCWTRHCCICLFRKKPSPQSKIVAPYEGTRPKPLATERTQEIHRNDGAWHRFSEASIVINHRMSVVRTIQCINNIPYIVQEKICVAETLHIHTEIECCQHHLLKYNL